MNITNVRLNVVSHETPQNSEDEYFIPVIRVKDQSLDPMQRFPIMVPARLEVWDELSGRWIVARIGMWAE